MCLFALLTVCGTLRAADEIPHGMGLVEQLPAAGDDAPPADSTPPAAATVDLSPFVPTPMNQGYIGSCASCATGYALGTYLEGRDRGWDVNQNAHRYSPSYLYPQANGGRDNGTTIDDNLAIMVWRGCASMATQPYTMDYTTWPTQTQFAAAQEFRNSPINGYDYEYVLATDINGIKTLLDQGQVLVIGIIVDTAFTGLNAGNNYVWYPNGINAIYGHALAVVGYDDNKTDGNGHVGAFKIQNSWGTGWGQGGYCWFAYDAMYTNLVYSALLYGADREDFTSTIQARIKVNHPRRGHVQITVGVGNPANPDWQYMYFRPLYLNSQWYDETHANVYTAVDVTDAAPFWPPTNSRKWWVKVRDNGSDGATGTLTEFTLVKDGQTLTTETPLPVSVLDYNTDAYAFIGGAADDVRITNVTSSLANGQYGADTQVPIQVTFSDAVNVDTTGGAPTLQLETGDVDRQAVFTGGSGTNTLTFTYTVQSGDATPDLGVKDADSLLLNGALLSSASGMVQTAVPVAGMPGSLSGNKDIAIFTLVFGDVVYVDQDATGNNTGASWQHALTDLQLALNFAAPNQEIWVAEGTYKPGSAFVATFQLKEGVRLYGGFAGNETTRDQRDPTAHPTILSGDVNVPGSDADNVYTVITAANNCRIDGFTISHGNARQIREPYEDQARGGGVRVVGVAAVIAQCRFEANRAEYGASIYAESGASLAVSDCVFTGNNASFTGSGIYSQGVTSVSLLRCVFTANTGHAAPGVFLHTSGQVSVTDCEFTGNTATGDMGAMRVYDSNALITGCTFLGNSTATDGGGLMVIEGTNTVSDCTFTGNQAGNSGGGLYVRNGETRVKNCTVSGNQAKYGAGLYTNDFGELTVANCVFTGNTAINQGGGAYASIFGVPFFVNCTFTANSAGNDAGGLYSTYMAAPTITNCILWGNTSNASPEIGVSVDASLNIGHTILAGGIPAIGQGEGCTVQDQGGVLAQDPAFANAADPDGADNILGTADDGLRLSGASPALNAGLNNALPAGVDTDITGAERIQGGTVDLGAYEGTPVVHVVNVTSPQADGTYALNAEIQVQVEFSGVVTVDATAGTPTLLLDTGDIDREAIYTGGASTNTLTFTYTVQATDWSDDLGYVSVDSLSANGALIRDPSSSLASLTLPAPGAAGSLRCNKDLVIQPAPPSPVVYVDAAATGQGTGESWDNAFTRLQDALAAARPDQAIWVATGTYTPGPTRGHTFQMKADVDVLGGFAGNESTEDARDVQANPTILSGDIGVIGVSTDNVYHVVRGADTSRLDGFIITLGHADGAQAMDQVGGGMLNVGCTPMILNCTFTQNHAVSGGGLANVDASVWIGSCTFAANSATENGAGMLNQDGAGPVITDCTFTGNMADGHGGGMHNQSPPFIVSNSLFAGNGALGSGGAIYNDNPGRFAVAGTTFDANNAAHGGGAIFNQAGASIDISRCVFNSNFASVAGGGVHNAGSLAVEIQRSVFSANRAGEIGAGLYNEACSPLVASSLFWGNITHAGPGAGMANVNQAGGQIVNCTFAANVAEDGAALRINDSLGVTTTLANCILYSDMGLGAAAEVSLDAGLLDIAHTDLAGGVADIGQVNNAAVQDLGGVMDADPLFVNPVDPLGADQTFATADDGFALQPTSPCINAGDNPSLPVEVEDDLTGADRILLDVVDLGAYEAAQQIVNVPPVADAECHEPNPTAGHAIPLSGSGSYDPDNGPQALTYTWSILSQPEGSVLTDDDLDLTDPVHPLFTPVVAGTYTFRLVVSDGMDSDTDEVSVVVAPGAPTPLTPNGNTLDATPTFTWGAVAGATTYDIEIRRQADDAYAVHKAYTSDLGDVTAYVLPASHSLASGLYYWRVRAKTAASVGSWSANMAFSVQALAVPGTVAPTGMITDTTPTFTWTAIAGATNYDVEVRCQADDSYAIHKAYTHNKGNVLSYTPVDWRALAPGAYYWRVRCQNADNNCSAWSAAAVFTVQVIQAPGTTSPTGTITDATPTFAWTAVADAASYDVEVRHRADDSYAIHKSYTHNQGNVLSYTPVDWRALAPGDYYWQVRAKTNAGAYTPWSDHADFTVQALVAPGTTSPTGAITDTTPTFTWTAAPGAVTYDVEVRHQADDSYAIHKAYTHNQGNVLSYTPVAWRSLAFGAYYWRVRARMADGNYTIWSANANFEIQALAAPIPAGPSGSSFDATPTFTWGAAAGAVTYDLEVRRQADDAYAIHKSYTYNLGNGLAYTLVNWRALPAGDYHWRVRAKTAGGTYTPWSGNMNFRVNLMPVPALGNPSGTTSDPTPTFSWGSVAQATNYDIEVRRQADDSYAIHKSYTHNQGNVLNYTPVDGCSLPAGDYYWRVRCRNEGWNYSDWSMSRSFTVQ